ncbi:MAG: hypothetical protein SPJ42_08680, partial [Oscillospiraceae bacterium]|nr:hypothetical protein [Oscillospiraceae bacterium]
TSRRENDAIFRREQAPALLCAGIFYIIIFRATALGRRDWDDVGIVPYELYRKLTVKLASFGKGGGTAKP